MGPYEVVTTFENGSVEIKTIDHSQASFVVNGHRISVMSHGDINGYEGHIIISLSLIRSF